MTSLFPSRDAVATLLKFASLFRIFAMLPLERGAVALRPAVPAVAAVKPVTPAANNSAVVPAKTLTFELEPVSFEVNVSFWVLPEPVIVAVTPALELLTSFAMEARVLSAVVRVMLF